MQLTAAIVGPAHGLRGEVILDVRSDDPEVLTPGRAPGSRGTRCRGDGPINPRP